MMTTFRTAELGQGWFANLNEDGSMDVRNCDQGQRIHLEPASVELLRECFRKAEENV